MKHIARSTASSAANPVLDLWTLGASGLLEDVSALKFTIFDSAGTQVYPTLPATKATVNVSGADHLATGHYVAAWTVGGSEALGLHSIVWYVGADEIQQRYDFDVLTTGLRAPQPAYALLSMFRDEGFTSTVLSDRRGLQLIQLASKRIENWTRRSFEARFKTITLDGKFSRQLTLDEAIITVSTVTLDDTEAPAETFKVYNRHLTERLLNPDDRMNPRIVVDSFSQFVDAVGASVTQESVFMFPRGPRRVGVAGLFGYTDPTDDLQIGVTPDEITRATVMLVQRENAPLADPEAAFEAQNAHRVKDMRTRDQSISYGPGRADLVASGGGEFTGDPRIDDIIERFMAPLSIGSV